MNRTINKVELFTDKNVIDKRRDENEEMYLKAKNFVFCGILIKMPNNSVH